VLQGSRRDRGNDGSDPCKEMSIELQLLDLVRIEPHHKHQTIERRRRRRRRKRRMMMTEAEEGGKRGGGEGGGGRV